jgi:hypothetical protein
MEDHELEMLRRHPQWESVLNVYKQVEDDSRLKNPEFDGWMPRVHDVPEVASTELPGIHGKLIAFGFLKFDLAGRDGGIRYQLTQLGHHDAESANLTGQNESKPIGKVQKLKLAQLIAGSAG